MLSSKSIESLIFVVIMNCRGYSNLNNYQAYSNKGTLNHSVTKM